MSIYAEAMEIPKLKNTQRQIYDPQESAKQQAQLAQVLIEIRKAEEINKTKDRREALSVIGVPNMDDKHISSSVESVVPPKIEKEEIIYTIKPGDNLTKIAKAYSTKEKVITINELLELNPQYKVNPNLIKIGDSLIMPNNKTSVDSTHPVKGKPEHFIPVSTDERRPDHYIPLETNTTTPVKGKPEHFIPVSTDERRPDHYIPVG